MKSSASTTAAMVVEPETGEQEVIDLGDVVTSRRQQKKAGTERDKRGVRLPLT